MNPSRREYKYSFDIDLYICGSYITTTNSNTDLAKAYTDYFGLYMYIEKLDNIISYT